MLKALIVGSSSMLGKNIKSFLQKQAVEITTLGRHQEDTIFFDFLESNAQICIPKNYECDVIFHCVGSFESDTLEGALKNELINHIAMFRIIEVAKRVNCKHIVYAGSIFSHENFLENSYGFSKKRAEELLLWAKEKYDIQFTSLRFSQLIDDYGECLRHQPWYARIIRYTHANKEMHLPSILEDGEALRNYIHAEDAAQMMINACVYKIFGIYNFCNPQSITCSDLTLLSYKTFNTHGKLIIDEWKSPFRKLDFTIDNLFLEVLAKKQGHIHSLISMEEALKRIRNLGTAENFGDFDIE